MSFVYLGVRGFHDLYDNHYHTHLRIQLFPLVAFIGRSYLSYHHIGVDSSKSQLI